MSYITMERFLAALYDACPTKVEAVRQHRRTIEHGLLTVGIKLHCLKGGQTFARLTEELGGSQAVLEVNYYRRTGDSACLVLPPVGSAWCAVLLIECIEHYEGTKIFGNKDVQIQVCTPGRLTPRRAGLLTLAFHLGSDQIRGYDLDRLETTFSDAAWRWLNPNTLPRGRRITIYDGRGALDRDFQLWAWKKKARRRVFHIRNSLPHPYHRTDVLAATSRVDIHNINLVATLLAHWQYSWCWNELGARFAEELEHLLKVHQLGGYLDAPWVSNDDATPEHDQQFREAMSEIMVYALEEVSRVNLRGERTGILYGMHDLLLRYRGEIQKPPPQIKPLVR